MDPMNPNPTDDRAPGVDPIQTGDPATLGPPASAEAPAPTLADWKGRAIVLAFALVAAMLLFQIASGRLGAKLPAVGTQAAPLEFEMLGGSTLQLAELRGKVVLLDFWATWCPPCVESMPTVERLGRELADQGLVAVAVNRDDLEPERREALIRRFLDKHELDGLQVALDDGRAAGAFGVRGLPTLVILDPEGRVAATHLGAVDEETLRELVKPVLAQVVSVRSDGDP